jgi:nitrogen-specific signal transduction histidine kinase
MRDKERHRGRRIRREAAGPAQLPWRQIVNPYSPIEVLQPEQIERIHDTSLRILQEIGIEVDGAAVFVRHAAAPEGVWLDVNARPLGLAGGGAVAVFRDVTEQRKLQEQLMVSDRMASVGTLASGVAHEINNPLASVMANLHLAVHGIADLAARLGASTELDELREELDDLMHRKQIGEPKRMPRIHTYN